MGVFVPPAFEFEGRCPAFVNETEDPNIFDKRKMSTKLSSNVTWAVGWLVITYQIRRRLAAPGRSLLPFVTSNTSQQALSPRQSSQSLTLSPLS